VRRLGTSLCFSVCLCVLQCVAACSGRVAVCVAVRVAVRCSVLQCTMSTCVRRLELRFCSFFGGRGRLRCVGRGVGVIGSRVVC